MRLKGIRAYLMRELQNAESAAALVRAQRLAMAAAIAGLRAELSMLQNGGPQDLTQITRARLAEMIDQLEHFDREVAVPAEARRAGAQARAEHFEVFVDRVIAA